jgi:hypothetical protein
MGNTGAKPEVESIPKALFISDEGHLCIGNTCIDEQMLKRLLSPVFTTEVISTGTVIIPVSSFSPAPTVEGSYRLRVRRSDGNYAWRYNGIVDIVNGKFRTLSPIDKTLIDVTVTDGSLVLNVISNTYPDKWILTLV